MANVSSYYQVEVDENSGDTHIEDASIQKYNSIYERAYGLYEEIESGDLFEDDTDLVEEMISDIEDLLSELKSDYREDEQESRVTEFSNENLKHYRTHFNNLKKGLEGGLAELRGESSPSNTPSTAAKSANSAEDKLALLSELKEQQAALAEKISALTKEI